MKVLIVAAHPDDEVLGAGASIKRWTGQGHSVDVAIMCSEAGARAFRPDDKALNDDFSSSSRYLGIGLRYEGSFPNIEMNTVPHLRLVQFIEQAILRSEPDIVITHHPADPNNDHMHTSLACQEAVRLAQRRPEVRPVSEFWYMEVPSCTEWMTNSAWGAFRPNCYVEAGPENIEAKIKALAMYRGVMRPYPHPRSEEYIRALATVRGSEWGTGYAEAFQIVLRKI